MATLYVPGFYPVLHLCNISYTCKDLIFSCKGRFFLNDSPADLYDHYLCLGRTDLYYYRSFLAGSGGGQDALLAGSVGIDLMATLNSDIDPGGMTSNG